MNVPEYDFEWQHRYVLAAPTIFPESTVLRCTAVYDNSAANPKNADPTAVVKAGELTKDEMLLGIFNLGYARPQPESSLIYPLAAVAAAGAFVLLRKR